MKEKRIKLCKKHDVNASLRFRVASRTQIIITLQQNISAVNLNSISSLNFQLNTAKYKCSGFSNLKPYLGEMEKVRVRGSL